MSAERSPLSREPLKLHAEQAGFEQTVEGRQGSEPGNGALGLLLDRRVDPIGGDLCLGQPPQVLAGHQLGGTEGQEDNADVGRRGCGLPALGVVGWGVVPDEQLGDVGTHLAERLHEGRAVVLAAALTDEGDEVAGGGIERTVHDAATGAAGDDDHLLLAPPRPGGPQRRELPQRRLLTEPDLPTCYYSCRLLSDGFFFLRTPGPGAPRRIS